MSILAIITTFVRYLPDLIGIVKQIIAWIQAGVAETEIRQRLADFGKAIDAAKTTHNTSGLEDAFKGQ